LGARRSGAVRRKRRPASIGPRLSQRYVGVGRNELGQKSPQSSPPGRTLGAIAYDSGHGRVVLFGGNSNRSLLNDTWLWDGSNWAKESRQTSPSGRQAAAMAYDSYHRQTVLFGGGVFSLNGITVSFSDLNDTWTSDGVQWTQRPLTALPSARDSYALAYDPSRDLTMLFGGATGAAPNSVLSSETWTWTGGPVAAPVVNGVASASDFGAFSSVAPGSWIAIYGSSLWPGPRSWTAADFHGRYGAVFARRRVGHDRRPCRVSGLHIRELGECSSALHRP
jgi:hypothetical protein